MNLHLTQAHFLLARRQCSVLGSVACLRLLNWMLHLGVSFNIAANDILTMIFTSLGF